MSHNLCHITYVSQMEKNLTTAAKNDMVFNWETQNVVEWSLNIWSLLYDRLRGYTVCYMYSAELMFRVDFDPS